jgi:hypothetical protein
VLDGTALVCEWAHSDQRVAVAFGGIGRLYMPRLPSSVPIKIIKRAVPGFTSGGAVPCYLPLFCFLRLSLLEKRTVPPDGNRHARAPSIKVGAAMRKKESERVHVGTRQAGLSQALLEGGEKCRINAPGVEI